MNMIEKIKAAMRATGLDCAYWNDEPLTELARAAIEAMREPTEGMIEAGRVQIDMPELVIKFNHSVVCWPAMIDAALKEGN